MTLFTFHTASVKTTNDLQTSFKSSLKANASFSEPLRVIQMDSLRIEPSKIKFSVK